ncbi:MAG: hypothetical protein M3228_07890 [Actinomycetota bacterium]|nr:hypothetical protein [Actinomycetota bacterium]
MQAERGDSPPSAPPARPSRAPRALPSELAAQPRPRLIDLSYWLWLAACLIGVITAAATLRYFGDLQDAMFSIVERQFPDEARATNAEVATAAVAILIGAGVLAILVQMALAMAMHSGRGWARFALIPAALLGALYSAAVFGTAPTMTKAGLLATTVLMVIAVVPMFLPGARAWFAQRGLTRSGSPDYSE